MSYIDLPLVLYMQNERDQIQGMLDKVRRGASTAQPLDAPVFSSLHVDEPLIAMMRFEPDANGVMRPVTPMRIEYAEPQPTPPPPSSAGSNPTQAVPQPKPVPQPKATPQPCLLPHPILCQIDGQRMDYIFNQQCTRSSYLDEYVYLRKLNVMRANMRWMGEFVDNLVNRLHRPDVRSMTDSFTKFILNQNQTSFLNMVCEQTVWEELISLVGNLCRHCTSQDGCAEGLTGRAWSSVAHGLKHECLSRRKISTPKELKQLNMLTSAGRNLIASNDSEVDYIEWDTIPDSLFDHSTRGQILFVWADSTASFQAKKNKQTKRGLPERVANALHPNVTGHFSRVIVSVHAGAGFCDLVSDMWKVPKNISRMMSRHSSR